MTSVAVANNVGIPFENTEHKMLEQKESKEIDASRRKTMYQRIEEIRNTQEFLRRRCDYCKIAYDVLSVEAQVLGDLLYQDGNLESAEKIEAMLRTRKNDVIEKHSSIVASHL